MLSAVPLTSAPIRQGRAYAAWLGVAAAEALAAELACYPKPGLVSFVDAGAHADMNAETFLASIEALRGYFVEIAQAGLLGAEFPVLQALGIEAEQDMLAATGGINTHRGAIFALGLIAASVAHLHAEDRPADSTAVMQTVARLWGPALAVAGFDPTSHGAVAARRYGAGGARAQAVAGFPILRRTVLPAIRAARGRGADDNAVAVEGFFASLSVLEDTNLLHRGGPDGLAWSRGQAARWRAAGGLTKGDGHDRAVRLHAEHIRRNLSPGGSADMLAAGLFLDRIGG